jgi:hypothetical protein
VEVSRIAAQLEMLSKNDQLEETEKMLEALSREVERARRFITEKVPDLTHA